jgi:hypothetical protein
MASTSARVPRSSPVRRPHWPRRSGLLAAALRIRREARRRWIGGRPSEREDRQATWLRARALARAHADTLRAMRTFSQCRCPRAATEGEPVSVAHCHAGRRYRPSSDRSIDSACATLIRMSGIARATARSIRSCRSRLVTAWLVKSESFAYTPIGSVSA